MFTRWRLFWFRRKIALAKRRKKQQKREEQHDHAGRLIRLKPVQDLNSTDSSGNSSSEHSPSPTFPQDSGSKSYASISAYLDNADRALRELRREKVYIENAHTLPSELEEHRVYLDDRSLYFPDQSVVSNLTMDPAIATGQQSSKKKKLYSDRTTVEKSPVPSPDYVGHEHTQKPASTRKKAYRNPTRRCEQELSIDDSLADESIYTSMSTATRNTRILSRKWISPGFADLLEEEELSVVADTPFYEL